MTIQTANPDRRFLLRGVSWETYEVLLADVGERTSIRLSPVDPKRNKVQRWEDRMLYKDGQTN